MTDAYPLAWPPGWKRTNRTEWSRFKVSQQEAQSGLIHELQLLGAREVVVSTNVPLRRDGLPCASRREPYKESGAA